MSRPVAASRSGSDQAASGVAGEQYRYERKFVSQRRAEGELRALIRLHPAGFREAYPPRYVNNVYLDSRILGNYQAHMEGVSCRHKTRVRWYGDLRAAQATAVLELKIRRGLVGNKRRFELGIFDTSRGVDDELIRTSLAGAGLPSDLKCSVDSMQPTLLNRYRREYFVSLDNKLRLTVDSDQSFYGIGVGNDSALVRWRSDEDEIIELKYAVADDDVAARASQHFPFRLSRHSKYARGISLTRFEPLERYVI